MAQRKPAPQVGVVMGSDSDWDVMQHAAAQLGALGVPYEARVVSAHRMPDDMFEYAAAAPRGLRAIIAGAGGAAHLPGMLAAKTLVPVLGVPVPSKYLHGEDSLLSIVQMPKGIPVATFAIGEAGAANAGLFAVALIAATDAAVASRLAAFRARQTGAARAMRVPPPRASAPMPASRPDPGWASSAAGSSAGCSAWPRKASVTASPCSTPGRTARPAAWRIVIARADYLDTAALNEIAAQCRAATTEFENVPAAALEFLARSARVAPAAMSVAIAQDRIREKPSWPDTAFASCRSQRCATKRMRAASTPRSSRASSRPRASATTARDRRRCPRSTRWPRRWPRCATHRASSSAGWISRARCPSSSDATPPGARPHGPRPRIGIATASSTRPSPGAHRRGLAEKAHAIAVGVAEALDYVGVLCVELFVTRAGELLVNEIAPRPHNSGHYTIDSCVTSQFEQQARRGGGAASPLGATTNTHPRSWVNLLGDIWYDADGVVARPRVDAVLRTAAPSCICTARRNRAADARWATSRASATHSTPRSRPRASQDRRCASRTRAARRGAARVDA